MHQKPNNRIDLAQLEPEVFYHIYNRTNNQELLFKKENHRKIFLAKFKLYLFDFVDTYTWCLMGNHFHLLIKVKSQEIITRNILKIPKAERTAAQRNFLQTPDDERLFHAVIERQFTRLFTAYAMIVNIDVNRQGNLFYRPFKRIRVESEKHLLWLVYYIHSNPARHGVVRDFTEYNWSSYKTFLSDKATYIMRDLVLAWFGGLEGFILFHCQGIDIQVEGEYLDLDV